MAIFGARVDQPPHTANPIIQEGFRINYKKEGLNALFCAASITFLSKHLFSVGRSLVEITKICPSSLLPNGITAFFDKYINYPKWFSGPLDSVLCNAKAIVYGPCFEELADRVILQEILSKRLLKKISPRCACLTDHYLARIARVFTSSAYFALHHSMARNYCLHGDMYSYFIAGAILGTMQEINGHPLYNVIAHIAANNLIMRDALGCSIFSLRWA